MGATEQWIFRLFDRSNWKRGGGGGVGGISGVRGSFGVGRGEVEDHGGKAGGSFVVDRYRRENGEGGGREGKQRGSLKRPWPRTGQNAAKCLENHSNRLEASGAGFGTERKGGMPAAGARIPRGRG